jgi:subtilisin family serine protease
VYGGITAPGNAPWVLTVGASSTQGTTDRHDDTVAGFSSRGPTNFDWAAKPDLVAPGHGSVSLADPNGTSYEDKAQYLRPGAVPTAYLPYLVLSGTSMAAPVVSGTVALMLQANPALTPNMVKAILQFTAQEYAGYDALTQGAGFLNAVGAVRLAEFFASAEGGQAYPVQSMWSRKITWGNYRLSGGVLMPGANAFALDTTWGAEATTAGDNIVWGTSCGSSCDNIIWGTHSFDNIVWGTSSYDNIVWGTNSYDNIVWGTNSYDNIVWGTNVLDNIVWGTSGSDNIIWGTSGFDNVIWGTNSLDNIIWGTSDNDNIIWGTSGDDNIIWGTSLFDNIIWGTSQEPARKSGKATRKSSRAARGSTKESAVAPGNGNAAFAWGRKLKDLTDSEVFSLLNPSGTQPDPEGRVSRVSPVRGRGGF